MPENRGSQDPSGWAVNGTGQKLRFPDGALINGEEVARIVKGSGMELTNEEAADHIIKTDSFVSAVVARLGELSEDDAPEIKVV